MNEVTRILSAIERGDPLAAEQLLPLVYDELRKLAARHAGNEAAAALGVVRRTADRDWAFARAWLFRRLAENSCRTADPDGA